MSFKIKDGVRIGTTDVFNNAGTLLVNAPTATALATARTISISGAVTGTATSFDGSANITISATALAAGNLSGTIPSAVLGTSTVYIGTTAVALNRATGAISLTGTSIDGNAGTVTNGVYTTGSYADPAWITSLSKSKVGLGNVENTALSTWAGSTNITTIGAATATSLTVTGNLIVNGSTTTVNSTVTTIDDPVITLGGDTAPASDDGKDRGIEFRWHNGTAAKVGFFGFDDSTGKFTFIPDATNSSEVFSGTKGTLDAYIDWADITNKPAIGTGSVTSVAMTVPTGLTVSGSPITTSGTFAITLTSGYSIPTTASQTNWDTAYTDRNKWDGGATGLVAATGRTSLGATTVGSNLFTLTNPSAVTFIRVNADNTVSALDAATFRTAIGAQASGTYLTAEADTLATVTGRGSTTTSAIQITNNTDSTGLNTGALRVSGGVAITKTLVMGGDIDLGDGSNSIARVNTSITSLTTTTATTIDSWTTSNYRSAKYLVQVIQGTNYQVSEMLVIHDGTTTSMTEYAVLETGGTLATFTTTIIGGGVKLQATPSSATNTIFKIYRTTI